MKKKILSALLCGALVFSMTACGSKESTEPVDKSTVDEYTVDKSSVDESSENAGADMVIMNGTIQTMVSEDDTAEAVAVIGGEIVYVGENAGVEEYIGENTEVIDLDGKYVTPGFIDGHIHMNGPHLTEGKQLSLASLEVDLEVYKKAISEFVEANPDFNTYIIGSMDLKAFPDSNAYNSWLDEICADKPIEVGDVSLHGRLLNTYAIELCGITKETADPPSGLIYKDENGELTGYFSDCTPILTDLPEIEYTEEDYENCVLGFEAEANSYGITSVDSGGDSIETSLFRKLEDEGALTIRVNTNRFVREDVSDEAIDKLIAELDSEKPLTDDFVYVNQVKFILDGVPEGKSAYLLEPYDEAAGTAPDYVSSAAATQDELNHFVARMNEAGYAVQTHCMGDASVQLAVNAFEYSAEQNGLDVEKAVRNKIAHFNLIVEEDCDRMVKLGGIAAMQPLWFYYDPFFSPLEEQMFGRERFDSEYHIKDMIDKGLVITGSNDYYVTLDFAPLHAIEAGATQCSPYPGEDQDIETYTRNADQAVSVYEMLKMYTVNAAYAAHMENNVGSIEIGKKADFVILSDNILTCDVKDVSDVEVLYTISDGRIVYQP